MFAKDIRSANVGKNHCFVEVVGSSSLKATFSDLTKLIQPNQVYVWLGLVKISKLPTQHTKQLNLVEHKQRETKLKEP